MAEESPRLRGKSGSSMPWERNSSNSPNSPMGKLGSEATGQISQRQSTLMARRESVRVDVASFAAENYRPESYLRMRMEADTEEAVQAVLQSLSVACDKSIAELRRAVYKNHVEFLKVSKEITDFEVNLGELRNLQTLLRSSATALVSSAGVASVVSLEEFTQAENFPEQQKLERVMRPPETPKPPLVDMESRRAKMATLVESISDFEKYNIGDRYLVFEGGGLNEQVGLGSLKPISLYLFNDSLAMATKKSRLALSSLAKKMTLEHFWMLNEVSLSDVPDSKNTKNAIKIMTKAGGESILLQAETPTGKRLWLQQITKAQKSLNLEEERPSTPKPVVPSLPSTSPMTGPKPASPRPKSPSGKELGHRRKTSAISIGAKKNESIITTIIPDIPLEKQNTMMILLDRLNRETDRCMYDAAVETVDKIKYELAQMDPRAPTLHNLQQRLTEKVSKLAGYLYHEIADLIIGKEVMSQHIQRLVVLGFPDEAREKFLAARSDFIRERTKHLRFVGDIAKTVNDIGFATFSSISTSADWYISSFKDNTMTAGFVFWIKLEINNYVNMIVKQVFSNDSDFRLIGDCVAIARRQCASLGKVGLDFVYYLDDQLLPHINQVLESYQRQCEESIKVSLSQDDFMEDKVAIAAKETKFDGITTSTAAFYQAILMMLNDVEPLLLNDTSDILVSRLASFFENYSTGLVQASYSPGRSSTAFMNIISNVAFLASEFLPSLTSQLEERFCKTFADLARLCARLEATVNTLYEMFSEIQAHRTIPKDLSVYSTEGPLASDATISDWLITMLPLYAKISRDAGPARRSALMGTLLQAILVELTAAANNPSRITFGECGLQLFLLDIHFLLLASTPFLREDITQVGLDACDAALKSYRKTCSSKPANLYSKDWYDQRARELMGRYPLDFGF